MEHPFVVILLIVSGWALIGLIVRYLFCKFTKLNGRNASFGAGMIASVPATIAIAYAFDDHWASLAFIMFAIACYAMLDR